TDWAPQASKLGLPVATTCPVAVPPPAQHQCAARRQRPAEIAASARSHRLRRLAFLAQRVSPSPPTPLRLPSPPHPVGTSPKGRGWARGAGNSVGRIATVPSRLGERAGVRGRLPSCRVKSLRSRVLRGSWDHMTGRYMNGRNWLPRSSGLGRSDEPIR